MEEEEVTFTGGVVKPGLTATGKVTGRKGLTPIEDLSAKNKGIQEKKRFPV